MATSRKVRVENRSISRKLCYLPMVVSQPPTIYSSETELRSGDPVSDALSGFLFHNLPIHTRNRCHPYWNDLHSLLWKLSFTPIFLTSFMSLVRFCWSVGCFVLLFPRPCGDLSGYLVSLRTDNAWRWPRARWKPSECYWGAFCLVQELWGRTSFTNPYWLFRDVPKLSMCLTFFSLL